MPSTTLDTTRRSRAACAAALLSLLLAPAAAFAQDEGGTVLPGIVIEGTDLGLTEIPVDSQGSAVTVVTRDELETRQAREVADVLRQVPGLAVSQQSGQGSLTQVRIRGAESRHTLVMIDGIEVNSSLDNEFDFSDLLVEDIERVEVIRGPQSGLWGPTAIGGVVNIVTPRGKGPARATAAAEYGSFDTRRFAAGLSGGSEWGWGSIGFSGHETDGFNVAPNGDETDGSERTNVQARGGLKLSDAVTIEGSLRTTRKHIEFDAFDALPGAPYFTSVDLPGAFTDAQGVVAGGAVILDPFAGAWKTRLYANLAETERDTVDPIFGPSQNKNQRRRFGVSSSLSFEQPGAPGLRHTLTGLAEATNEDFSQFNDPIERSRELQSLALDYRAELLDQVTLGGSVRQDDSDAFGTFTTWRVTGGWRLNETGTRLHASYGTGFMLPSMIDQFGLFPGFFIPNPNLQPETSEGYDVGIEQRLLGDQLTVDVTYFDQNLQNEIVTIFPPPTFSATPINLDGESRRSGIEASLVWRPVTTLDITASYTHLDAVDDKGAREIRRPVDQVGLSAAWHFAEDKGIVTAGLVWNGTVDDFAFNAATFAADRIDIGHTTLLTLGAQYDVTRNVRIYGRIENALDEDYQEVFGFETAGVSAYAGVKVKIGDDVE